MLRLRRWEANPRARRGGRAAALALLMGVTLLLSGCAGDLSATYNKAIAKFASADYAAAADAFDQLGNYQQSATYAAYSHGLVYYEQGDFAAAEPFFEKTQDFMYGKQRYTYCHADGLQAASAFDQASETFASLVEFEDAPVRAAYCKARNAEDAKDYETALFAYDDAGTYADAADRLSNLQSQVYDHARELKAAGSYDQALDWFGLLGDYFDAQAQAKQCKDVYRDQLYDQADTLAAQGKAQEAYNLFSGLGTYRDAAARAEELATQLGLNPQAEQRITRKERRMAAAVKRAPPAMQPFPRRMVRERGACQGSPLEAERRPAAREKAKNHPAGQALPIQRPGGPAKSRRPSRAL